MQEPPDSGNSCSRQARYGLESNSLVDERRDPIKATWAAARYLKDLYGIYNDWNLVIAAYNCGPGTINKAIRRAGGKTDYWDIYNYLPRETRGYVPAFIAANCIMSYYCKHNICPMETNIPAATDTVQVSRNLHFEQVADICHVPMDALKSLNPQYKLQHHPRRQQAADPASAHECHQHLHRQPGHHLQPPPGRAVQKSPRMWPWQRAYSSKAVAGTGKPTYYKIKMATRWVASPCAMVSVSASCVAGTGCEATTSVQERR